MKVLVRLWLKSFSLVDYSGLKDAEPVVMFTLQSNGKLSTKSAAFKGLPSKPPATPVYAVNEWVQLVLSKRSSDPSFPMAKLTLRIKNGGKELSLGSASVDMDVAVQLAMSGSSKTRKPVILPLIHKGQEVGNTTIDVSCSIVPEEDSSVGSIESEDGGFSSSDESEDFQTMSEVDSLTALARHSHKLCTPLNTSSSSQSAPLPSSTSSSVSASEKLSAALAAALSANALLRSCWDRSQHDLAESRDIISDLEMYKDAVVDLQAAQGRLQIQVRDQAEMLDMQAACLLDQPWAKAEPAVRRAAELQNQKVVQAMSLLQAERDLVGTLKKELSARPTQADVEELQVRVKEGDELLKACMLVNEAMRSLAPDSDQRQSTAVVLQQQVQQLLVDRGRENANLIAQRNLLRIQVQELSHQVVILSNKDDLVVSRRSPGGSSSSSHSSSHMEAAVSSMWSASKLSQWRAEHPLPCAEVAVGRVLLTDSSALRIQQLEAELEQCTQTIATQRQTLVQAEQYVAYQQTIIDAHSTSSSSSPAGSGSISPAKVVGKSSDATMAQELDSLRLRVTELEELNANYLDKLSQGSEFIRSLRAKHNEQLEELQETLQEEKAKAELYYSKLHDGSQYVAKLKAELQELRSQIGTQGGGGGEGNDSSRVAELEEELVEVNERLQQYADRLSQGTEYVRGLSAQLTEAKQEADSLREQLDDALLSAQAPSSPNKTPATTSSASSSPTSSTPAPASNSVEWTRLRDALESATSRISDLELDASANGHLIRELQSQLEAAVSLAETRAQELEDTQLELQQAAELNVQSVSKLQRGSQLLESLREELEGLKEENEQLKTLNETYYDKLELGAERFAALKQQLEEERERNMDAQAQSTAAAIGAEEEALNKAQNTIADLQNQLTELQTSTQAEIEELSTLNETYFNKLKEGSEYVKFVRGELAEAVESNEALLAENKSLNERVAALEDELVQLNASSVGAAQLAQAQLQANIQALQTKLHDAEAQNVALRADLDSALSHQTANLELFANLNQLREQNAQLSAQNAGLLAKVDGLEANARAMESNHNRLNAQLQANVAALNRANDDVQSLTDELELQKNQNESLLTKLQNGSSFVEKMRSAMHEMTCKAGEDQQQIEQLETELTEAKSEIESLRSKIESVKATDGDSDGEEDSGEEEAEEAEEEVEEGEEEDEIKVKRSEWDEMINLNRLYLHKLQQGSAYVENLKAQLAAAVAQSNSSQPISPSRERSLAQSQSPSQSVDANRQLEDCLAKIAEYEQRLLKGSEYVRGMKEYIQQLVEEKESLEAAAITNESSVLSLTQSLEVAQTRADGLEVQLSQTYSELSTCRSTLQVQFDEVARLTAEISSLRATAASALASTSPSLASPASDDGKRPGRRNTASRRTSGSDNLVDVKGADVEAELERVVNELIFTKMTVAELRCEIEARNPVISALRQKVQQKEDRIAQLEGEVTESRMKIEVLERKNASVFGGLKFGR